jgi:hypothetical protein
MNIGVAFIEMVSQFLFGEVFPPFGLAEQVPALGGIVSGLLTAERS